jgi:hypothetical protein
MEVFSGVGMEFEVTPVQMLGVVRVLGGQR